MASLDDPVVRTTMQSKYVDRFKEMPSSVLKGSCVESLAGLKENWLNLEPGVSGGFGGMRNEYLRCAAQNWEDDEAGNWEAYMYQGVMVVGSNADKLLIFGEAG